MFLNGTSRLPMVSMKPETEDDYQHKIYIGYAHARETDFLLFFLISSYERTEKPINKGFVGYEEIMRK